MNILIAEDEKVQIETLRRGLRTRGFKMFEALNGKQALEQLSSKNKNSL